MGVYEKQIFSSMGKNWGLGLGNNIAEMYFIMDRSDPWFSFYSISVYPTGSKQKWQQSHGDCFLLGGKSVHMRDIPRYTGKTDTGWTYPLWSIFVQHYSWDKCLLYFLCLKNTLNSVVSYFLCLKNTLNSVVSYPSIQGAIKKSFVQRV